VKVSSKHDTTFSSSVKAREFLGQLNDSLIIMSVVRLTKTDVRL